jgi:2-polyprenyl-6-methoxyphenol hydroxylase-like FAD-dependent oxidoreductase
MLDFFGPGYDVAASLGLLPELEQIHYPIDRLVFLTRSGREKFSLSYPVVRKIFGNRHFNFLRGDLLALLYSKVKDRAQFRFSTSIESIEQDSSGVTASLSDGSQLRADLLVGADGFHSRVRSLIFGEEYRFIRSLGCTSAAFLLAKAPVGFEPQNSFCTLALPNRQVSLYPLRDGKLAAFLLYRADKPPQDLHPEAALRELRSVFGNMGWVVPSLLDSFEPSSFYFDQVAQIDAQHWTSGRVVLLGDAAYCLSLIAGQGASVAMAGAYLLAQKLQSTAGDVTAAATFYENRFRPSIERKQRAARRFVRWFLPRSSDMLFLRDLITRISILAPFRPLLRRSISPASVFEE